LFGEVESRAREAGIVLLRTPAGFTLAPLKDGEVIDAEGFDKLSAEERQQIDERSEHLRLVLRQALQQVALASREHDQQVEELNEAVTRATVERQFIDLEARYAHLAEVTAFLAEVKRDIGEKGADIFNAAPAEKIFDRQRLTPFNRYLVNVLVDNGDCQGAPLVYEDYPSYQNLIGRIEHQAQMGTLHTDFTLIKGGALHRANGGYLLLDARKLLTQPFAWEALKRALQARELRIQSLEQILSLASTISLEPDPIPLEVKVVLIGDRLLYYLLTQYDPEFPLLFKVEADFAEDIERSADNTRLYAQLIATLQRREQLRPLDSPAVARLIEQAARNAADGEKLSLHMQSLLDLMREADYWAGEQQRSQVSRDDVERAVRERLHRADQIRERLLEAALRDLRHIDTDGSCVAQINGLAVLQTGAHAFGHPARISATARLGDGKLIDIEREVELGGALHSKGVLILSAYLASRFGGRAPLSFSASLVFEQSYGGVDGDSASCAELCVLQSALANLPLRQDLAITGSVDQHGRMQVIGGVNEKIEGFFDLCAARGLSDNQGVIIPQGNVKHLMLRREVVEAVAAGRFHVHAIEHADQAMELLTGQPAGVADAQGLFFPAGTVNGALQQRLRELSELRQRYAHPHNEQAEP
jgi:lon-related putative ATP-dependent protease